MVPDEDVAVPLADRPRPRRGPWRPIESRHLDEPTVALEPPAVERAGDAVAAHATPDAQVGSQVGAVRIEDPGHPVLATEEHEFASEVGHRRARRPTARSAPAPTLNQPFGDDGNGIAGAHRATWRTALSDRSWNRPAKARSGRSALVSSPGFASHTAAWR